MEQYAGFFCFFSLLKKRKEVRMEKNRRGYTLVELMIVAAVIVVLALIAIPSIGGAIKNAKLTAYDENARTIFLAAETRLTAMRYSGELTEFNRQTEANKTTIATLPENADVRYMYLDAGQGGGELYELLMESVNDSALLQNSIFLEYSATTGRVYSVFYSDETDGFRYGGGGYTVPARSEDAQRAGMYGYYGVDELNIPVVITGLEIDSVRLDNGELLTLRWGLKTSGSMMPDDSDVTYNIKLYDINDLNNAKYSFAIRASDVTQTHADGAVMSALTTYGIDDANGIVRCAYKENGEYVLVLDALDASGGYGISEKYPDIENMTITASVQLDQNDPTPSENSEHTLFTQNDADGEALTLTDGQFGVAYPRHLYNIRYADAETDYLQLDDLSFAASFAGGYIFNDGALAQSAEMTVPMFGTSHDSPIYEGVYNGGGYSVAGAMIIPVAGEPAGLFGELSGTVKSLTLEGITVSAAGCDDVGGLVGINVGLVQDVTVNDAIVTGADNVGGVIGNNTSEGNGNNETFGRVVNCSTGYTSGSGAMVSGTNYVGGVIGRAVMLRGITGNSSGNHPDGLEELDGLVNRLPVTMTPDNSAESYAGGVAGGIVVGKSTAGGIRNGALTITDCTNYGDIIIVGSITTSKVKAGGITGELPDNSKLTVEDCVNRGDITGSVGYAGGITGYAGKGCALEGCDSYGDITNTNTTSSSTAYGTGGIAGYSAAEITGCRLLGSAKLTSSAKNVGGMAGAMIGQEITYCATGENTGVHSGAVNAGGMAGYTSGGISECASYAEVSADLGYAGGMAGRSYGSNVTFGTTVNYGAISSKKSYAGGILGYTDKAITLTACDNAGAVTVLGDCAGGIVGSAQNAISLTGCDNAGNVKGGGSDSKYVGGIMGYCVSRYACALNECYNGGAVFAEYGYAGGILGYAVSGTLTIDNCGTVSAAIVSANGNYVGGIAGWTGTGAQITDCVNNAVISGEYYTGGIIGYADINVAVTDTDNSAAVSGGDYTGGIAGWAGKTMQLTRADNRGDVSGGSYTGGIAGGTGDYFAISSCDNTGDVYGSAAAGGVAGMTGKGGSIASCKNSGDVSGINSVGGIVGSLGGTAELSGCFTENITVTARSLTGTGGAGGIAGVMDTNSTLTGCYVTGGELILVTLNNGSSVGGIAGVCDGTIRNSTDSSADALGCTMDITMSTASAATARIGGIAGQLKSSSASITGYYFMADINLNCTGYGTIAGGIAGYCYNYPSITRCYNIGKMLGAGRALYYRGSIVGYDSRYVYWPWTDDTFGVTITSCAYVGDDDYTPRTAVVIDGVERRREVGNSITLDLSDPEPDGASPYDTADEIMALLGITPTPSPTETPTVTPAATPTATPAATATDTSTATETPTSTDIASQSNMSGATATPEVPPSATPEVTLTPALLPEAVTGEEGGG